MTTDPLARVALAISTFRSDDPVLKKLATVFKDGTTPFGEVIVVDSVGSGRIPAEIERQGWRVTYINATVNLGAAGNLALRLKTAAGTAATWCFAVNHDGQFDLDNVRKLVTHGESADRVGAVYPSLFFSERGATDGPKKKLAPRAVFDFDWSKASGPCETVAWSSSNCALYSLDAIREGVEVWADLWIGWDDLALGWSLGNAGWRQLQCGDVIMNDDYEYQQVSLLGQQQYVVAKPIWYAYYQIRNLILIHRRTNGEGCSLYHIFRRIFISTASAMLFGRARWQWAKLFGRGIVDGLRGKAGKGVLP
jgi:GT2 family glycosyltransferase